MRKFLLLLLFGISFQVYSQNLAPVAINDTVLYSYAYIHENDSIKIDLFFLQNDTDPNGNTITVDEIIYTGTGEMIPFKPNNKIYWLIYKASPTIGSMETFDYIIKDNGAPVMYDTGTVTIIIMNKDYESLNANNINANINKDVLFSSPLRTMSGFEAPTGSGSTSIFAANLWITGNLNGTTHSNIRRFGVDPSGMFPSQQTSNCGPVSNTSHTGGLANTKWDRVWKVSQHQIDWHLDHWTEPGYNPPTELLEWPAHGIIVDGEAQFLAPYVDVNQDTLYNPYDGDYPIIKGDQAIYFIYNDGNSPISLHPMISEVHGMAYAFSCQDSALQNTIFVDYKIFNRSNNTFDSTFVGLWSDMDLGNANDDYVQCDVMRNLYFMFNGDDYDEDFQGNTGYYDHPPAQGIIILKGAKQDDDGMDNSIGINLNETVNGTGFGDGISDNEHWGMEFSTFFNNSTNANPTNEQQYAYIQSGHDYSGTKWALDFNQNGTYIPYKFAISDTSDPLFYGTGGIPIPPFTESLQGNIPADRRILATTGPVTFKPGDVIELTYAFVFGRDYIDTGAWAGVTNMLERVDSIQSYYDQGLLGACGFPLSIDEPLEEGNELLIYPNPTKDLVRIQLQKAQPIHVEIFDVSGKVIYSVVGQSEIITVDLSPFTNGIYLIKATTKSATFVEKVIKK